jgi:hypothetical protein
MCQTRNERGKTMEIIEYNLATMGKIAENLKERAGSFPQFDGVVYELIEDGLLEAEAGKFVKAVWDGEEIAECQECLKFQTNVFLEENSGLLMCHNCYEEGAN